MTPEQTASKLVDLYVGQHQELRDAIAAAIREAEHGLTEVMVVDGVIYGENMIRHLQQQVNECRAAGFIDPLGNVRRVRYFQNNTNCPVYATAMMSGETVMVLAASTPPGGAT